MEVLEKVVSVPTYEYRRYDRQSLLPVFSPKTVAVIGASEEPGSIGRTILWNLISNPYQ
jgi:acetyltransferase